MKSTDEVFARLDHYRMHDASSSRSNRRNALKESSNSRKRGRPPKYPKSEIPQVPRVQTKTDLEWLNDAKNHGMAPWIRAGFEKFARGGAPCPDYKCPYHSIEHYHCVRERCYSAVDRFDVLDLHSKTFHGQVIIQDGFEYFDRTVDCRRAHCPNNKNNKHFHCTRSKCDYSFIRPATMSHHSQKHEIHEAMEAKKAVICEQLQSAVINVDKDNKLTSETPTKHSWEFLKVSMQYSTDKGCGRPFCKMKRRLHYHCSYCSQTFSEEEKLKVHVVEKHNVPIDDRTFNFLNQNHLLMNNNNINNNNILLTNQHQLSPNYLNNQNISNNNNNKNINANVNSNFTKESKRKRRLFDQEHETELTEEQQEAKMLDREEEPEKYEQKIKSEEKDEEEDDNEDSEDNGKERVSEQSNEGRETIFNGRADTSELIKKKRKRSDDCNEQALDLTIASKRVKLDAPNQRPPVQKLTERSNLKDKKSEGISSTEEGFIKFKFSDDCSVEKCNYRLSGSHYHCSKPDCLYSFTDKSKGELHLLRHKKIDEVIGSDFKLIRSHQNCPDSNCNISQAHYHCILCSFSCSDRGKVASHRKIHKLVDGCRKDGFVKVTTGDQCDEYFKEIIKCTYSGKCVHFHCLKCTYITLNNLQIRQHLAENNH